MFRKVDLCPVVGKAGRVHKSGPALDEEDWRMSVARIATDDLGLIEFDAVSRAVDKAGVSS